MTTVDVADNQQEDQRKRAPGPHLVPDAVERQLGVVIVEVDQAAGMAIHTCMASQDAEARLAIAQRSGEQLVAFVDVNMPANPFPLIEIRDLDPKVQERIADAKERLQRDHLVSVALAKYGVPDDPLLRAAVHCAVVDLLELRRAGSSVSESMLAKESPAVLRRVA